MHTETYFKVLSISVGMDIFKVLSSNVDMVIFAGFVIITKEEMGGDGLAVCSGRLHHF